MSQTATIAKESIIVTFSHIKAKVAKFDLVVKQLKVGLSFEQTIVACVPDATVSLEWAHWF